MNQWLGAKSTKRSLKITGFRFLTQESILKLETNNFAATMTLKIQIINTIGTKYQQVPLTTCLLGSAKLGAKSTKRLLHENRFRISNTRIEIQI